MSANSVKSTAACVVSVDCKVIKQAIADASDPGQKMPWQECLLPTETADHTFVIKVERSPQKSSRTKAKQNASSLSSLTSCCF
jgi:hypothetical protein